MRSFLLGGRGQGEELTEDKDSMEEAVLCLTSWFCFCWTSRWAGDSGLTESIDGREPSLFIEGRVPGASLSMEGRPPSEEPTSISRDGRVESPTSTSIEWRLIACRRPFAGVGEATKLMPSLSEDAMLE
jgi:hypothetical protein